MEKHIIKDLSPVFSEFFLEGLRAQGFKVYAKQQNLDGWIKSVDLFLIYQDENELQQAEETIRQLQSPTLDDMEEETS